MKLIHVFGAVLVVTAAGCVLSAVDTDEATSDDVGTAAEAIKPAGLDTAPAYFNYDNRYSVADESNWTYAHFTSYPGKQITVDLHQRPSAEEAAVGFKLYSVARDGELKLVRTVDGRRGSAVTAFKSRGTGSYVVEMVSSGGLGDLELRLSCRGGRCSPDRQPGELCGGIAGLACAEALYCGYKPEASCGAGDQGGSCSVKPTMCQQIWRPVCGCDGRTYSNACLASSAGVSIKSEGECPRPIAHEGESCGGFTMGPSPVCAAGLYCSYRPSDICGWADAPGTCAAKPEACDAKAEPVCGCDGETYESGCVAAFHGMAVNHPGKCVEPAPN